MSVLVVIPPERDRSAAEASDAAAVRLPADYGFVFSSDGQAAAQAGRAALAALPKADRTVLVMGDAEVSWHRVLCPKAPANKLRAALSGVMEDMLLDDDEQLHLALAPGGRGGQKSWVAAMHRPWLQAVINALEAAGHTVDKVVALSLPMAQTTGHFALSDESRRDAPLTLTLCRKDGVLALTCQGALARSMLPGLNEGARWTATPNAAAAAERWLGERVAVLNEADRLLNAARSSCNLRQFSLASSARGWRTLKGLGQQFFSPAWAPLRWGLAALVGINLVALNAFAWSQNRELTARKSSMTALLQGSYPQVRTIIDPPLQMQRETERARAAAGRVGEADLETLLGQLASAWPEAAPPSGTLRFESGRLTVSAAGWSTPQVQTLKDRLAPMGVEVEAADGRLTVSRAVPRAWDARSVGAAATALGSKP